MSNVIQMPQRDGLTADDCNQITAKLHHPDLEFGQTDEGHMWASKMDHWLISRYGGKYILSGYRGEVFKESRALSEVIELAPGVPVAVGWY